MGDSNYRPVSRIDTGFVLMGNAFTPSFYAIVHDVNFSNS